MKKILVLFCLLSAGGAVDGQQSGRSGKPIHETSAKVLYKAPPDTPAGLFRAAEAVVVVTVNETNSIFTGVRPRTVETEIRCTVISVVKTGASVGGPLSELVFRVNGGEVDRGTHIERLVDGAQPRLMAGRKYLVALVADASNVLRPAFGPTAIFDVTNGRLSPQASSRLGEQHRDTPLTDFIAAMKKP